MNQKTRQALLAVNELELAVVSVKTDRAVVVLCAFVVGLCLRVVAKTVEVFEKLSDFADWPAVRALIRRDIDGRLAQKKTAGEDSYERILKDGERFMSGFHALTGTHNSEVA